MSEVTSSMEWPAGYLEPLLLIIVCLVVLFEHGRPASERLSISVGGIHIGRPTLVAMAAADNSVAVGLLGGAIHDYLVASESEPSQ